jgi:hypothetical protein
MKLNAGGTGFEVVGTAGFSAGKVDFPSIAFNGTVPYVVYVDLANSNKATVMKLNAGGTGWEVVGTAGFSAESVVYTKLAFNGNIPYVVYRDNGNSGEATVMKLNAGGTGWEVVGTAGFSAGGVVYTSIINTGSELIVAYSSGRAFAKSFPLTTLPVKLTSYEVSDKNQNQVNLTWQTASETNNAFFTISKSQDGKTFEPLLTIKSKGDNGATYETIDFSPFAGTSYYKLIQTDLDGKTEELGIRTVKRESLKEESLVVYPNPIVNSVINIQQTELNGLQSISIYDLSGKEVLKDQVNFSNGAAEYKMNTKVEMGIYILKIGNAKLSTRILIQ